MIPSGRMKTGANAIGVLPRSMTGDDDGCFSRERLVKVNALISFFHVLNGLTDQPVLDQEMVIEAVPGFVVPTMTHGCSSPSVTYSRGNGASFRLRRMVVRPPRTCPTSPSYPSENKGAEDQDEPESSGILVWRIIDRGHDLLIASCRTTLMIPYNDSVWALEAHRRSPSPRSLLSTNYFAAPECLSEQMCALSPTERAERDSVIRITSNALDTLRFGVHPHVTREDPPSAGTAPARLSFDAVPPQFHSGEFLVARYNCAPSLARFVSALHAPHVPPHDTNNTSLSEQENEKKEKCSNKQKDGKKELEATKLEASKTLKKDKRITRKHRSYGFCLKPTDRDQVDPEVQVRNCSFVACTSVEMFLVGLCLPLDPSSAHFDSVGGRRSNFRRIFFDSEEERHHGVWHNIHDAKTAKVLRSLLEVDKDTVEGSFDFTIFGVPLVSFNSFSVSGHALLAITTEQPTSSVSVNFEDITQTIAGKARCVHVTSSSLGTVVTPSTLGRIVHSISASFDFVGCDSSLTSGHPFFGLSLLFYLLPVLGSRLGTRSFTQHRAFRVEYNICFFFRIRKWSKTTLRVELTDTDTLCFTTIRIESCSLTGAPLLSLVLSATQHTNWDLNLKGISFAEESSNSVLSGALIFISGTSFATQLALSRFPPVYPVTDENKFW
ncbi:hypothetical protein BLNAU_21337 [Blattamonas nauphoetae]|uniref:Uncharacterized protein n=1 Tax=Blattamonas nauphoetae TaxID=2049346 RepID=A0ABQ9WX76_9EUKA|nr:hypothetical protein BLNAU_21337 [Blattamonas nauphoetae]